MGKKAFSSALVDGAYSASIFQLPEGGPQLRLDARLEGHVGPIHVVAWHSEKESLLLTVEDGALRIWSAAQGGVKETAQSAAGSSYTFWTGAFSYTDDNSCCTSGGPSIQIWDLRTMKQSSQKEAAHAATVRDVDFAHQSEHTLASCGDDCRVKVWDLRSFTRPVVELANHAHWVWQARFNPGHDQLLLSSSSDAVVNLMHLPSMAAQQSSEHHKQPATRRSVAKDMCAATFDVHEDSVHGVAWSAADPWVFASLSYDGRVAINRVPSSLKYKILI